MSWPVLVFDIESVPDVAGSRLYCRFQKLRGGLLEKECEREITLGKDTLGQLAARETHWDEYLRAWA